MRYWLPLVAAFVLMFAATRVSAILAAVLTLVAFFLVIEVSTKLFENGGKSGSLNSHRQ